MKTYKVKKELPKLAKIVSSLFILILFVTLNFVIYFCDRENASKNEYLLIANIVVGFIEFAYFVIPDIINIKKMNDKKIYFKNEGIEDDFCFVDREKILKEIDDSINKIIKTKRAKRLNNFVIKNVESKPGNGKTTLCKKIINTLYSNGKIKYVDFIDNLVDSEELNNYFKTHTFVKYALNVIVINMKKNLIDEIKKYKDIDILFIIIAQSNESNSLNLDLSIEDVKTLITYKNNEEMLKSDIEKEAYCIISITKNVSDILIIIKKGGSIYFDDKIFIHFYNLINDMHYYEAMEYYKNNISEKFENSLGKLKATYEYANILHFMGKYSDSIEELEMLIARLPKEFKDDELKEFIILKDSIRLLAHIYKHIGDFNYAYKLLTDKQNLFSNELSYNKSFFSILIFCYNQSFLDKNYKRIIYLDVLEEKLSAFKKQRNKKDEEYYFYETYYPVFFCYKNEFSEESLHTALKSIDIAINYYEKKYRRFLTNCYFLKAEIYRHLEMWENAKENYLKCFEIYENNNDKDILYMISITIEMINMFNKIQFSDIPIQLNFEHCQEECIKSDQYSFHKQLFYYISQYKQDKETYKFLENYFFSIVNPIP